jgi:hypothetical protein
MFVMNRGIGVKMTLRVEQAVAVPGERFRHREDEQNRRRRPGRWQDERAATGAGEDAETWVPRV